MGSRELKKIHSLLHIHLLAKIILESLCTCSSYYKLRGGALSNRLYIYYTHTHTLVTNFLASRLLNLASPCQQRAAP